MFDNAQLDQGLLDCLDWLDQAGTIEVDLPGGPTNEMADVQAMLLKAAHEKLHYLMQVVDACVSKPDHPMVNVKRWTNSQGFPCVHISIAGGKLQAIEKLMKLTGGYYAPRPSDQSCY